MVRDIALAKKAFDTTPVRQVIGAGAGAIEINAASTYLKVAIRPEAAKYMGLGRLAPQIIDALKEA